jgi:hypothetical protein
MKKQIVSTVMACKSSEGIVDALNQLGAKWVSRFLCGKNGINPSLCKASDITTTIKACVNGRIYAFAVNSNNKIHYFG